MIYKKVIDRILDNLGIENENGKTLKTVKNDIYDTLLEIFSKTRLPTKTYSFNLAETFEVEEDFADETYIANLGMVFTVDSGSVGSGYLSGSTPGFTLSNIKSDITQIVLNIEASVLLPPSSSSSSVTAVTIDSKGTEVDNETVTFDETDGQHDITITLSLSDLVGGSLVVTTSLGGDTDDIKIYTSTFTVSRNQVDMPSDFVMPREVIFQSSNGRFYVAYELTKEEYLRWKPNATYDDDESFIESVIANVPDVIYANQENVRYDRSVGYYFDRETYTDTKLIFKPTVPDTIGQVVYVAIPSVTVDDGTEMDIIELWIDLLVFGATIRGARRLKADKDITEIRLLALRDIMMELKPEYKEKLHDFHGIMNKPSTTHTIIPWDFMNDRTMLRGD